MALTSKTKEDIALAIHLLTDLLSIEQTHTQCLDTLADAENTVSTARTAAIQGFEEEVAAVANAAIGKAGA